MKLIVPHQTRLARQQSRALGIPSLRVACSGAKFVASRAGEQRCAGLISKSDGFHCAQQIAQPWSRESVKTLKYQI